MLYPICVYVYRYMCVSLHVEANGYPQVSFDRCYTPWFFFKTGSVIGLRVDSSGWPASLRFHLPLPPQRRNSKCVAKPVFFLWLLETELGSSCSRRLTFWLTHVPAHITAFRMCKAFWISEWFWPKTFQGTIMNQCSLRKWSVNFPFLKTLFLCFASRCFDNGPLTRS